MFKEIIKTRKQKLTQMQRDLELEQLLQLKKKIYEQEIYQQQQKEGLLNRLFIQEQGEVSTSVKQNVMVKPTKSRQLNNILVSSPIMKQTFQSPIQTQIITTQEPFNLKTLKRSSQKEQNQSKQDQDLSSINKPQIQPRPFLSEIALQQRKRLSKFSTRLSEEENIRVQIAQLKDRSVNINDLSKQSETNNNLSSRLAMKQTQKLSICDTKSSPIKSMVFSSKASIKRQSQDEESDNSISDDTLRVKMNEILENLVRKRDTYAGQKKSFNELMGIDHDVTFINQLGQDLVSMLISQTSAQEQLKEDMNRTKKSNRKSLDFQQLNNQGPGSSTSKERHLSILQVENIVSLIRDQLTSERIPIEQVNEQMELINKQLNNFLKKEDKPIIIVSDNKPTQNASKVEQSSKGDEDMNTSRRLVISSTKKLINTQSKQGDIDYIQFYQDNQTKQQSNQAELRRHDSMLIGQYNIKQKQADNEKRLENIKKAQALNDDQKKMFLQADTIKITNNAEEVDEQIEFLQARMLEHKKSQVALFSNFQKEMNDNRISIHDMHSDDDDDNVKYILKKNHGQKTQFDCNEEDEIVKPLYRNLNFNNHLRRSEFTNPKISPRDPSSQNSISSPMNSPIAININSPINNFSPGYLVTPKNDIQSIQSLQKNDPKLEASYKVPKNQQITYKFDPEARITNETVKKQYSIHEQSNPLIEPKLLTESSDNEEKKDDISETSSEQIFDEDNEEVEEESDENEFQGEIEIERNKDEEDNTVDIVNDDQNNDMNDEESSYIEDEQINANEMGQTDDREGLVSSNAENNLNQGVGSDLGQEVSYSVNKKKSIKKKTQIQNQQQSLQKSTQNSREVVKVKKQKAPKASEQAIDSKQNIGDTTKTQLVVGKKAANIQLKVNRKQQKEVALALDEEEQSQGIEKAPQLKKKKTRIISPNDFNMKQPKKLTVIKKSQRNAKIDSFDEIQSPESPDYLSEEPGTLVSSKRDLQQKKKTIIKKAVKQVEVKPLTPLKKTNLKDELELLSRRNLSLTELKKMIDSRIIEVGETDDETKYNVHRYQQRQRQLKDFSGQLKEIMTDAQDRGPECSDVVVEFYENRNKYKEVTERDKTLKFSNQVIMDEQVQDPEAGINMNDLMDDVQANIQRMINLAHSKILKETVEERRALFIYDTEQLKHLSDKSTLKQFGVEAKTQLELMSDQIKNKQKKDYFRSSIIDIEDLPQSLFSSQKQLDKLERLKQKLRQIKKKKPDQFNGIMDQSNAIKNIENQEGIYLTLVHKKLTI